MGGEWTRVRLADLCEFRAGSVFKPEYQGQSTGTYPFVKVSDMNLPENSVRIQAANNWVSESDIRALKAKPLPQATVVFAKIGEALRQNRLRQVVRDTVVDNNMMGAIPRRERVDPAFFYYALAQFNFADIAHGTALPYLTVASLSTLELACPPLAEQRAIARILGALDDKIELNRKMNATLEAMARALFKSWFVDFDPVRAKAEGRAPSGMAAETAKLFPSEFVDTEFGKIPRGWTTAELRDLTSYLGRGLGPAYLESGGVCVINQKCIRDRRVHFSKARRHDPSRKSVEGRFIEKLDVLVNSTGVGTLGRVAQIWSLPEPTVVDSHVTIVRAAHSTDPWYLGTLLLGRETEIEALGEGSTGQTELSRVRLGALACVVPPLALQHQFGALAAVMYAKLAANQTEADGLARLRDDLLPRLLSGELPVNAAERAVEEFA